MPRLAFFLCILALPGCGPRLEVARDRLLEKVDGLLGEVEVKRREIDPAITQAESTLNHLKKGRIEVQVRVSQISRDLTSATDRLGQIDKALSRLRDLLAEERPVEIAGTTYTPTQLRGMANRTISARKGLAVQAETLQSTKVRLENVVALLERREQEGRDQLDSLKGLLSQIDAKAVTLKAVREAARAAEDAGALDFRALERQVRDLESRIDSELKFHEESLKQSAADSNSVETNLTDTRTSGEVVAEIDELLGGR